MSTAYATLVIVTLYYAADFVPKEFTNRIDRALIRWIWRKRTKPSKRWETIMQKAVLVFSDQQVVTGIATLISAYAQLSEGISVYHWQTAMYLAWFSSLTHLTTLTFLRQYFRENHGARMWRTVFMSLTLLMLVIGLLPTGESRWIGTISENTTPDAASCFFKLLFIRRADFQFSWDSMTGPSMVISVLVLLTSYVTRMIRLSKRFTDAVRCWLVTKPGRRLREAIARPAEPTGGNGRSSSEIMRRLGLTFCYVIFQASYESFRSLLWEVSTQTKHPSLVLHSPESRPQILWLVFALIWGSRKLVSVRIEASTPMRICPQRILGALDKYSPWYYFSSPY